MASSVPLFILYVLGTTRHIVDARNGLDLATLLPLVFASGNGVGLLHSFDSMAAAKVWMVEPSLPQWVTDIAQSSSGSARPSCAGTGRKDLVKASLSAGPSLSTFVGLLTICGGFVACKDNHMEVVRLLNTLRALCGTAALVSASTTREGAVAWLQRPRFDIAQYVMDRVSSDRSVRETQDVRDIIIVSDDDSVQEIASSPSLDVQFGASDEAKARAAALPPPPQPEHAMFSSRGMEEASTLAVVVPPVRVLQGPIARPSPLPSYAVSPQSSATLPPMRNTLLQNRPAEKQKLNGVRARAPSSPMMRSNLYSSVGDDSSEQLGSSSSFSNDDALHGVHAIVSKGRPGREKRRGEQSCGGTGAPDMPGRVPSPCQSTVLQMQGKRDLVSDAPVLLDRPPKRVCTPTRQSFDLDKLGQAIYSSEQNIFVTGGGGVGKTRLLQVLTQLFKCARRGKKAGLGVLAPTGVAAAVAGGVTLHAFLRLRANCFNHRLSEGENAANIYSSMNTRTKQRLATTDMLLLDEASMVPSRMFSTLVHCMRASRLEYKRARPWRMIAFGDFFQLPAVYDMENEDVLFDPEAGYAFESPSWNEVFCGKVLELKYVWRQRDAEFINMLSELRIGVVSAALVAMIKERQEQYKIAAARPGGLSSDVTHIFPRTEEVRRHNAKCLSQAEAAKGSTRVKFEAVDRALCGDLSDLELHAALDKALLAPKVLELCVGARVAMCGNSLKRKGIFSGTVGVVISFDVVPPRPDGRLAKIPIVSFSTVTSGTVSCAVTVECMQLESVQRDGPFAERVQVPLMLAWAVTVHRVQGLSLDRAVLDLARCFTAGMVYVSLSRVRSMSGVYVMSFDTNKVMADPTVRAFYERQESLSGLFTECLTSPA